MGFSLDSPIMEKGGRVTDLLIANALWLVCSLPIITMGVTDAALYYTIVKVVRRQRGTVCSSFFHALRCNMKQGIPVGVLYLCYGVFIAVCIYLGRQLPENSTIFFMAVFVAALPAFVILPWIFTVISRFDMKLVKQLQYALHMAIRHFPSTVLLLFMLFFTIVVIAVIPILILVMPGLYTLTASFLKERILKTYMREEREQYENSDELPWYLE